MFDDEIDVFFDEDDFAVRCTWSRPGETDVPFTGILATLDAEMFEGQAALGQHVLQFPTAAVPMLPGDVVRTVRLTEAGVPMPAEVWTVMRTPDRVVDGAESRVYLKPTPDA